MLNEIVLADREHAYRLLQCLTVAIRPLRSEELAGIFVLGFDGAKGETPRSNDDWQWEDRQESVLSTCSTLITLVNDGDSRVIQFSNFSVKEFLTSNRLATSRGDTSGFRIMPKSAHTTLARACLRILLQLDGSSNNNRAVDGFPLAKYASRHWVDHAQSGLMASIREGMRHLFDPAKPYFAAWLQLHDIDDRWPSFGTFRTSTADRGSPLYYASLCGFRDLAARIIVKHPEQVNARRGLNHSPLAAALHKRHFDVAELLIKHGAAVNVIGYSDRTPLQAASEDGLIDVVQWLIDHGADAESLQDGHRTPSISATATGHLQSVPTLVELAGVRIDTASHAGNTVDIQNITDKADGTLASHSHDNPSRHEPSEKTPSPYHYRPQFSTPPPRATLTPSLLATARGRSRSFSERELSHVPDAAAKATRPTTPIMRATPQATHGVSASLPVVSHGGAAAPVTNAPTESPFPPFTPSRSRSPVTYPERVASRKSDGDAALTPLSTSWSNSKRNRTTHIEKAEGYVHTRSVRQLRSACFTNTSAL